MTATFTAASQLRMKDDDLQLIPSALTQCCVAAGHHFKLEQAGMMFYLSL